jgi:pilus assembly protein CpaC
MMHALIRPLNLVSITAMSLCPALMIQAQTSTLTPGYIQPKAVHPGYIEPVPTNPYPHHAVESQNGVRVQTSDRADIIHLTLGHSTVLSTGSELRRIYVGDPKVLQSFSSGPKEEVITAKTCGVSTLILWDLSGKRRVFTVFADLETDGMLQMLQEAVPGARLTISTSGSRVYLAGTAPTDAAADALARMAQAYTKDVVDGVKVVPIHSKQIQLKLRIIEVDRSRLEQFGVNFFALGGSTLAGTGTGQFASTAIPASSSSGTPVSVSDPLNMLLYSAKLNAGVTVKDLEQKQVLQILAEPTLTTLSGVPARFLSGGEFPLPVVQGGTGNSTAITIIFKPYGVKVDFTPTVNPDGSIRLKVAPEVSALDYTNSVTVSGFVIPALSTRRAETEVELADGQSFVITGLLDNRTSDNLSRMPGIAEIPILGQLFRSKGITRSVVELVVLVTASIVDPLAPAPVPYTPAMVVPNLNRNTFDQAVAGKNTPKDNEIEAKPAAQVNMQEQDRP